MRRICWLVVIATAIHGCGEDEATTPDPVDVADTASTPAPECACDAPGPCQTAEGALCLADGSCVYPALECDDSDLCNGNEACDPMKGCVAGEALVCDDGDACNGVETCAADSGCRAGDALECDDGDACNGMEHCDAAAGCTSGTPLECDDGLDCNGVETCDEADGCVPGTPVDGGCCQHDSDCEDGNVCNGTGFCDMSDWTCVVSDPPTCDDGNPCNGAESCQSDGGCVAGTPPVCDDSDACNGQEFCDPATGCVDGEALLCDDGNPCNGAETCQSDAGCVLGGAPACDDGNACNGLETCDAAAGCVSGTPLECDDGLVCTGTETCDAALGCVSGPPPTGCCTSDADCDDGNACNGVETCQTDGGACVSGTVSGSGGADCDDANPCTADSCDPATGECTHVETDCDDANACTSEVCGAAGACAYTLVDCDDADACTADSCTPADGCAHTALPCDDGNACNGLEVCNAAAGCLSGAPVQCDDANVCNGLETCDPDTGDCLQGVALVCTDGNPCNGSETCDPGVGCQPGLEMSCDDGNACTVDSCDSNTWMCVNEDLCAAAMKEGAMVYSVPDENGNTFSCNTCHALDEPAEDGIRRVGHRLGDATRRPSYKNGALTDMRDAANSCRQEWMNAPEWAADDPSWLALYQWLDDMAPDGDAPPIDIQIVEPPDPATGGDPDAGQTLFNMACVMCHGTNAVGTERGPPLAGVGHPESYVVLRVRTSGKADSPVYDGLTGGIMPFWGADRLTDEEVKNLAAFVNGVPAPDPDPPDDPDPGDPGPECGATHEKVGWTTTLSTKFHGVKGNATIVDDCTIEVTDFEFDGNGIDVQMYAATNDDYVNGFAVSGQLYNFPIGYDGDTLILKVPEGKTLDDIDGISVWCVAVGVSFGDGQFEPPAPVEPPPGCSSDHAKVGWTTTLSTKFHGVKGNATVVDDCTIVIDSFFFDGGGIDVQVYAALNGQYNGGFSISGQLYNFPIGYANDTIELTIPEGHSLDDIDGIAVWCVAVGVSFGDGLFAPP